MSEMLRTIGSLVAMMFAPSPSVESHAQAEAASVEAQSRIAPGTASSADIENLPRPFAFTDQLRVTNEACAFDPLDHPSRSKQLSSGHRDLTLREIVK